MQQLKPVPISDKVLAASDLYGARYQLSLQPYAGVDFSRLCLIFPGQSAARPKMGLVDLQQQPLLQQRFAQADAHAAAHGLPPASWFVETPEKIPVEHLAACQCLALFTLSVGLYELMLLHHQRPACITAHSFGEYAALVACGIIAFEDMLDIVRERDRLCPPAGQLGGMIAVSADAVTTRKAITGMDAVIANSNSPQQTAVSVTAAAKKQVLAALKQARLAAMALPTIPQPYHSPWLADAAQALEQYVRQKNLSLRLPQVPFLSSVTGTLITAENFRAQDIPALLGRQLIAPVNFIGQTEAAAATGYRHFVEVAHHAQAGAWIKAILGDQAYKTSTPVVFVQNAVNKKTSGQYDSKLVGFLNKVIASVTGYSITEISLVNNFQEDLGIDSIKKAQIVLNFLESQGEFSAKLQDGVMMSEIRTVEDVLAWYTRERSDIRDAQPAQYTLQQAQWRDADVSTLENNFVTGVPDCQWLALDQCGDQLAAMLANSPQDAIIIYDRNKPFIFLDFLAAWRENYAALKKLPQGYELVFVTDHNAQVEILAVAAFLKSVTRELGLACRTVHFDHFDMAVHKNLVEREVGLPLLQDVKFVGTQRRVKKLVPWAPVAERPVPKIVAAIGGSRGITRALLQAMIAAGSKYIYIMGRRSEAESRDDLAVFANTRAQLKYFCGDATNQVALRKFIRQPLQDHGQIDLFIHAGGVEVSAILSEQTAAAAQQQLAIKSDTTKYLVDLCRHEKIEHMICFSSVTAEFGSPGQTVYAYANQLMTEICAQARREDLSCDVIAWPAWDQLGMTENHDIHHQLMLNGYRFLSTADGCALLMTMLRERNCGQLICVDPQQHLNAIAAMPAPKQLWQVFPGPIILRSPLHLSHWTLQSFPALRDHVVLEQPIAPLSLCLASMLYLGLFRLGEPCALQDVHASQFMLLHQKDSPYFLDWWKTAEGLHTEIRSNVTHVQGKIVPATIMDKAPAIYMPPADTENLDLSYMYFDGFREKFSVLKNAKVSKTKNQAHALLDGQMQSMHFGSNPMHRAMLMIEAMLQLGGAIAQATTKKASKPIGLEQLRVYPNVVASDQYHIVAHYQSLRTDLARNNLYAYNVAGQLCAEIIGEQVRIGDIDIAATAVA
jgi:[acyl-carrier-protein] S-malonyltransferase